MELGHAQHWECEHDVPPPQKIVWIMGAVQILKCNAIPKMENMGNAESVVIKLLWQLWMEAQNGGARQ